jgi:hypothetical protein
MPMANPRTSSGLLTGIAEGVKERARGALAGTVSWASTAYHGRWYYANRWHPHTALLQDALDETVAYIKAAMPDALVKRDAAEVLASAGRHVTVDGLFLEFGVRTGTTINQIARRHPRRTIHGFDSFQGLPEAWTGWTMEAGAFSGEGLPTVEPNVELHVGWFDDTLPAFLVDHPGPAAFVHIDSDIYSSARTVLHHLAPRFRPGSIIVFNEYFNYPNWKQHEYRAFQEFCTEHAVRYRYLCWGMYEVAVEITSIGEEAGGGSASAGSMER